MGLEAEIRAALLTFSSVTAIVGTGATARIRPYDLDQGDDPSLTWIIIEVDTDDCESTLDGAPAWKSAEANIKARAKTLAAARTLADAISANLAGYSGPSWDAVLTSEDPSIEPEGDGKAGWYHAVNQSYTLTRSA